MYLVLCFMVCVLYEYVYLILERGLVVYLVSFDNFVLEFQKNMMFIILMWFKNREMVLLDCK